MGRLDWCPDFRYQHLIVAEIEAEQALVDANRELIRRIGTLRSKPRLTGCKVTRSALLIQSVEQLINTRFFIQVLMKPAKNKRF